MRTKNRNVLLRRAIESVINQNYTNWFLVIINDGGNCSSVETLLSHYQHKITNRIKLFHNFKSIGMGLSINIGLDYLQTELAVVHDDDDTWAPDFLSRMISVYNFENINTPSIKGIVCHSHRVYESIRGNIVNTIRLKEFNQNLKLGVLPIWEMLFPNRFPSISFIFDLEESKKIGHYDPSIAILGDWDFNIRFIIQNDIWVLAESLAFHHHREEVSGNFANQMNISSDEASSHQVILENKWFRNDITKGKIGFGTIVTMRQFNRA